MNPSGKPVMGVQASMLQHGQVGANAINNNVTSGQSFNSQPNPISSGVIPVPSITKSPLIITTPASPLVTVKHLPTADSNNCGKSSADTSKPAAVVPSTVPSVGTTSTTQSSTTPSGTSSSISYNSKPVGHTQGPGQGQPGSGPASSAKAAPVDNKSASQVATTVSSQTTTSNSSTSGNSLPSTIVASTTTATVTTAATLTGKSGVGISTSGTSADTSRPLVGSKPVAVGSKETTTPSSGTGPVSSHQSVSTSFGVKPISSQQESPITINSGCGAKINETHQIRGNAGEGNLQMQKSASPVNEINCPSSVTGTKSQEKTGLVEAKVASSGTGSLEISKTSGTGQMETVTDQGKSFEASELKEKVKEGGDAGLNAPEAQPQGPLGKGIGIAEGQSDSDSEAISASKLLEEYGDCIGEDVKLIVTLLENAGFCGPPAGRPGTAAGSRPSTAAAGRGSASRPGTAGGESVPSARPSTADRHFKDLGRKADDTVPEFSPAGKNSISARPSSAVPAPKSRSKPNGTTRASQAKEQDKEKVGMDSGKGMETPNSSRSGRASSAPRATSATTTQTSTNTTRTPRSKSKSASNANAVATSGVAEDLSARPKSALPSTRSRPSSTLYQHTASSAQKGILGLTSPVGESSKVGGQGVPTPKSSSRPSTRPRTAIGIKMGDSTAGGAAGDSKPTLKDQFAAFSRFGDTASDGKHITLSNSDKWMKQAKVIDGKKVTTTDTSICFKKLFKTTKKVPLDDFKKYVEDLAKSKKMEPQELFDKLTNCGAPGLSTATKAAHAGVVERLTDTSKYTGSHKERFDATGKGKGIEGRREVVDSSGYVASFKEKLDLNKDGGKASTSPTPAAKESSPAPAK